MEQHSNPTAQKLMQSFMEFRRAAWHRRSIAGYKPSEIKVLFCIKRGTQCDGVDMKVSDISKRLHVTSPTVTQLLKGLEADGLIERRVDPTDRRAVGITLTEKGEVVTRQAREMYLESLDGLIAYLGEEQSDQLAELLFKVSHYYKEHAPGERTFGDDQSLWRGDEDAW